MGSDLYKKLIMPRKDFNNGIFIGSELDVQQTKSIKHLLPKEIKNYVFGIANFQRFFPNATEENYEKDFFWAINEEDCKPFILHMNNDVAKKINDTILSLDDHYTEENRLELIKQIDEFKECAKEIKTIEQIEKTNYGDIVIYDQENLEYESNWYIAEEESFDLDYMRNPFKFKKNEALEIQEIFKSFIHNEDFSIVTITSEDSMKSIKLLSSYMNKDNAETFLEMFPLEKNEIIKICG